MGISGMNFVFYDTETTGTDRHFDQILQFAAVLTDNDFQELDRFDIRCRLMPHIVPAPQALRATRITPRMLTDTSLPSHFEAFGEIANKLRKWSPACFVGYNTLNFDEPFLRQAFYQTLHPIFLTNTGGNTRADIYRLVQAVSILAPNAIVVPLDDVGKESRRLDTIAPANGFDHRNAHEAMADVQATIFMAQLIRDRAPELWEALMELNSKGSTVQRALSGSVLILVELFGKSSHVRRVIGCGQNPDYDAQIGVFDLSFDPSNIIDHSVDELVEVLNGQPKPIRVIQTNNQPILLPMEFALRHERVPDLYEKTLAARASVVLENIKFQERVGKAISKRFPPREPVKFVEQRIYDGFYTGKDSRLMEQFHNADWSVRPNIIANIEDKRARELGYRIIFLERPELLRPEIRS
jgi:exodeoxyribonuclease I